ncbi:class I SAM-dependent methyltransferase [Sphingomonas sabuli]|uniref:Class I SAM-dependent methyltransferase n=1 Tax=Sphingomonas sabuli TaxID=2764186 RepID=A0A7G9L188_9SPHN|nr:class I SAM-dependent methyltransferase [Sphingomonas sabuli]QNM82387.1 class I SAM-dependent methyltransferase [Sphingomonas sabuli]
MWSFGRKRKAGDKIDIPQPLTINHGGTPEEARKIGAKWAETFELLGGLGPDQAILDIGCGPGRMAIAIGDRFDWRNDYTGFEIVRDDVAFARRTISKAHPTFEFVHIDAYNVQYNPLGKVEPTAVRFPADDRSIDFCFATSIFTHLFAADSAHYVREAARVTRGTFLSTWFVIDEGFPKAIEAGTSRFGFPHRDADGVAYEHADAIAAAVGHDWSAIQRYFGDAGLSCDLHRGAWRGDGKGARHSQDIIVARPR